ncbi:MAG: Tad domain-containing protein [Pseudomonadota bacterium]
MRVESLFPRLSSSFGQAKRFARREDGAVAYFSLVIFFLMFLIGGMAVDLMRYEHTRVTLQQTMDRSVLAGASLQQTLAPASVVSDYFAKAGLSEYLDASSIVVTQTMNSRNVKAKASAISYNIFMDMLGVTELVAPAAAAAEQRRTNVEIVLVLDISGSMTGSSGGTTKIAALKSAAKSFVDTVLANDTENRISIAIVPYNAQVNLPSNLRAKYNATYNHGVANINCLEVPASTYSSLNLSRTLAMPMYSPADNTTAISSKSTSYVAISSNGIAAQQCDPQPAAQIMLPSNNKTALKAKIDGLIAEGNTSIMLGMRWGVALLDPGARPMFDELIGAGQISSNFSGRPFDYNDPDKMKVIVLMTDGEHVAHNIMKDAFKTGLSPIWRSTDGYYSIQHTTGRPAAAGTNQYWVPHLCTSTNCRNGTNTAEAWKATPYNNGGVTQQNWEQVWSTVRVQWVAWQLYARALGTSTTTRDTQYTNIMNNMVGSFASAGTMNTLLQDSCTLTKAQGVVVYGIAFEAPTNGQTQISNCSSSPKSNYYFNATGLNISQVFQTIAANISQLRLTQ